MSLSSLPRAITDRLNVDHLSIGMGDQDYVWRSVLHGKWGAVIQWGRWPGCPYWIYRNPDGGWTRIANAAVLAAPGERFIRVGRFVR